MIRSALAVAFALGLAVPAALAEPLAVEAVMSPKEQLRLDFEDGSKHFLLMVRREGTAAGQGLFDGAAVVEFGAHDILPGVGGDPRGYLVLTAADGAIAYLKWQVRAIFVPGADGKPMLLDNGFWEVAGGTGRFAGLKGAGTLHIKAVNPTDRRFILNGEVFPAG
ncbi:MAG: hypothetical protein RQ752_03125 [Thermohalobaculum sp.]|nr:hypothetical protein [Thermohalobaculum sp.]